MENILSFLIQDAIAQKSGATMGIMDSLTYDQVFLIIRSLPILVIIFVIIFCVILFKRGSTTSALGIIGFLIGGIFSYLIRPSVPGIGQLDILHKYLIRSSAVL